MRCQMNLAFPLPLKLSDMARECFRQTRNAVAAPHSINKTANSPLLFGDNRRNIAQGRLHARGDAAHDTFELQPGGCEVLKDAVMQIA